MVRLAETATAEYAKVGEGLFTIQSGSQTDISPIEFVGAMGLLDLQELARWA